MRQTITSDALPPPHRNQALQAFQALTALHARHTRHAPWPYARLDVPALRAAGHRPYPIRQFVLKTRSRCNLACTYCYVYEMADQGWRGQPAVMAPATTARAAERIAEHAAAHGLAHVDLVLHGGEPLLTSPARLAEPVDAVRAAVARSSPCTRVTATVQTNGTLLTRGRLAALAAAGIRVGVSLDGGLPAHNARRVDRAGRPGFAAATRGLRLLSRHPDSYAGVLCVVDLAQDPVETYESLLGYAPPALGLLLPLAHHSSPPPGRSPGRTPYADWLLAVFERWWHDGERRTRIRIFEEVIALLLGLPAATETLGLAPATTAVIETDGSIEQADSLKSAYEGAAATGMTLDTHSFDQLLDHPGLAARQLGREALAAGCRSCELVEVCGGGHYPHRYLAGEGFRQPSVYCADLKVLIRHVAAALGAATARPPARPGPPSASGTAPSASGTAPAASRTGPAAPHTAAVPPPAAPGAATARSAADPRPAVTRPGPFPAPAALPPPPPAADPRQAAAS
ncbi:FxsB family cyclophane-forming radical SAM/SPASM peptide maturase [Streptomyces sp. H27-S2]|uniref:FxsB family cyclophane-forming radical SAM/SPASM peptide maturase n=1 Tax=Streptomyces antarcticus TaxID=2996458 RepID=UPI002271D74C|nr:FxsB family cyclophane-forming radical SAM/SPASM peptide maturase [Streptomyces sp. H27-S2]MCY0948336.1 FxsB family radical SAM/SPASM domain protein [Streptomyces sp. H27-S2]